MSKSFKQEHKPARSKLTKRTRVMIILLVWATIFGSGFIGMELYARHIGRFRLGSYPLQKVAFSELDRLKIYNKVFYQQHRKSFRQWPIQVPTFDAQSPFPQYLFKPSLRLVWANGTYESAQPGQKAEWSSNSWGFRNPEFQIRKPEGVIRIVCLGASTTEGPGLRDDETYPYFLQQELNGMFPDRKIEVINAGHHSFIIGDLLELMRQRVLPLEPDVILLYEARNNIQFSQFIRDAPRYCPGDCWIDSSWRRFLYSRSALFNLMAERFGWINHHPAPMPHTFDDTLPKPSVERYRKGLEEIVREAQNQRIKIVLSSFITLAHEGLRISDKEHPNLAAEFENYHYPYTPGEVARIFQLFNQQSAEVSREFNVPYADVAADFPREPRYFFHDIIHLNADGYRLLAHRFAQFLGEKVLAQQMGNSAYLQRNSVPQCSDSHHQAPHSCSRRKAYLNACAKDTSKFAVV